MLNSTIYLDTSFVAALAVRDAHSERAIRVFEKCPSELLATSVWTKVEFSSLVARRLRMKEVTERVAVETYDFFEKLMASFVCLAPWTKDFDLASRLIRTPGHRGLRAADALHLAIGCNHQAKSFYTFDKLLSTIAMAVGFKVL